MVEDGVPTEAEVQWPVKCLRNNRAGGPSRMRAKDLKGWLAAARRGEKERESATKDGVGGGRKRTPDRGGGTLGEGRGVDSDCF